METKKEIEKLLVDLKNLKLDRRIIERDLGYREFYIDQVISKGGNERFLRTLKRYHNDILKKAMDPQQNFIAEPDQTYTEKRRNLKNSSLPLLVPLIPVEAQAGYSKNYSNTDFLNKLEWYPILPGVDPHGAIWRFFQVDGESMVDFLKDGYYVLASQVPKEDWAELKDFIVYVIVTDDFVTIKYAAKRKNGKELVLIPKNKKYEQKALNIQDVKEIWKYRRHIGWDASAGEKLEIKI